MISVLIPVYNYDVTPLVGILHNELVELNIEFEIICLEDGSSDKYRIINKPINEFKNTTQLISYKNLGRIKIRKWLLDKAKYTWLLFLDADVLPQKKDFVKRYVDSINDEVEAIFGGIRYYNDPPKNSHILRWKYGIKYEQSNAKKRNRNPYKQIVSANMLIRRSVLESINFNVKSDGYGMDENYLRAHLKEKKIKFIHLDNEVFHLGLDCNEVFLNKTREAVENLLLLYNEDKIKIDNSTLLNYFKRSKSTGINYFLTQVFRITKKKIEQNLTSKNPSINLFQFYKLGYLCHKDLSK